MKNNGSIEFETIKSHKNRLYSLCGFVCVVVLLVIFVVTRSHAKYRVTQSIPLVNGTINYTLPDLNIIAITVDGESTDTLPDGNYELLDSSYCTYKDGSTIDNLTLNYNSTTKAFSITPYTTKGTKCYLDFVTATTKEVDTVLGTITVNLNTPDFSKTAQASCSDTSTCEETNGIYEGEDDDGTTYYFRGSVDNNWVRWAGFYWRIIRINGDGSIRMIYQGTSTTTTGEETQISNTKFNSSYNNNAYVGFKYTTNSVHGTGTNSTILGVLNTWYQNNLASYADDLDGNAGFCNDRQPSTSSSSSNGSGGTGTTTTYYAAYIRLYTNKTPTFECENSSDLFTVSSSNKGNKSLTYPIGLITADEVSYAGGVYETSNSSYYLYTNQNYWTMSPNRLTSRGNANVFVVYSNGQLDSSYVGSTRGVRPTINLRADVTISSGNGTSSNPYVVE